MDETTGKNQTPQPFKEKVYVANEEKVLLRDLQGYEEYKNKVRYRLIPYIW